MSAEREAVEVRRILAEADSARRREHGADGMLSCIRLRRSGRLVRVETSVRFGRKSEKEFEHTLDAGETSALYRALQIVRDEARSEADRLEASVAVAK